MPLTPQRFLADLYATPVRLESATRHLQPHERGLLARDRDQPWTLSDVPLLDEVAEPGGRRRRGGPCARGRPRRRARGRAWSTRRAC
ncbi:hypothetical protein GCM10025868_01650 [Angustibacter aerolatus]|uniref:Uncharacterized protein n=1 Tax=Angustibacter aerolatus TaxID=1162965 RepID=A0ABQ6J9P7_9ACTN|nr:hypothetical protein [Angustibacter aerolatus]GMA84915.1 hypothetical protein GCM10025868_01650 [Angustibacter aerolatus]